MDDLITYDDQPSPSIHQQLNQEMVNLDYGLWDKLAMTHVCPLIK